MSGLETHLASEVLRQWQVELGAEAEALRLEIKERTARLSRLEEQISLLQRLLALDGTVESSGDAAVAVPVLERELSLPNGSSEFEDAVEELLRRHGKPMHISAIRSALINAGRQIPGRGDEANIIVRLRKYPERFTRTARGTYSLAEWGLPELQTTTRRPRGKRKS